MSGIKLLGIVGGGIVGILGGGGNWLHPPQPIALQPLAIAPELTAALAYPTFLEQPAQAATYRQRGLQARQQGDLTAAIAHLTTAVALAPRHVSGQVLLGWTQHLAGQSDAAVAILQRALADYPDQVPALNALGIVYLVRGEIAAAIAIHSRAYRLQADNEIAAYNLSLAYQRQPNLPAAIDYGLRATELDPENPHPWVALALAYWSDANRDAAGTAYGAAVQRDPRYCRASHLDPLAAAGFSPDQIDQVEAIRQMIKDEARSHLVSWFELCR